MMSDLSSLSSILEKVTKITTSVESKLLVAVLV